MTILKYDKKRVVCQADIYHSILWGFEKDTLEHRNPMEALTVVASFKNIKLSDRYICFLMRISCKCIVPMRMRFDF